MSIAAAQATKFYEQVVRDGNVFTFVEDGIFLVFTVRGVEVVPFWSSRSRLVKIQKEQLKYANYEIEEIPVDTFYERTLHQLAEEGNHVGVNWSGKRLVGYDVSVSDLRRSLDYWKQKLRPDEGGVRAPRPNSHADDTHR